MIRFRRIRRIGLVSLLAVAATAASCAVGCGDGPHSGFDDNEVEVEDSAVLPNDDAGRPGADSSVDAAPADSGNGNADATGTDSAPLPDAGHDAPIDSALDVTLIDASGDAIIDARVDAPVDATIDAARDATVEAGADATVDATIDAPVDATADARPDVGPIDATIDATLDATIDAPADAAPDAPVCQRVPPSNTCGLAPQCGCAPQQTCNVTLTDGTTACTGSGAATLGHACNRFEDCATGLACIYGACRPYCSTPGTACVGAGLGQCSQYQQGSPGVDIPNLKTCDVKCDLTNPNSCGGCTNGMCAGCYYTGGTDTDCETAGTARQDELCSNDGSQGLCAPGYACVGPFPYTCAKWCRLPNGACDVGTTCQTLATTPVINGVSYGVCF